MKVEINGVKGKLQVRNRGEESPALTFRPNNSKDEWYLLLFKPNGQITKIGGLPSPELDNSQPFQLKRGQVRIKEDPYES